MTGKNIMIHTKNRRYFNQLVVPVAVVMMGWLAACNKFLDVAPKDKVPETVLLNNEQGFKDALTGVYLNMDKNNIGGAKNGLYTCDLTMGMVSTMAFEYDTAASTSLQESLHSKTVYYYYTETSVKTEISGVWGGMYNNIANLNNILKQIDDKKGSFTGDNYYRIKGEATALRALFHFDLARLFGQSPVSGMNAKAIPYVTRFNVTATPFSTLQVALDSCISDLTTANALLAQTDTSAVLKAVEDPFVSYTQNHLNYWAVQGLLARVYLYKGDTENAAKYARAVIASNRFPLIGSNVAASTNTTRDRTFSQELLFALYSTSIKNNNLTLFNLSAANAVPLMLTPAKRNAIYITGSGSGDDYRYKSWFDNSLSSILVPSKYFQDAGLPYALQNIVPLIRASEMYYIAAECANSNNDIITSVDYLNQVRLARGISALKASGISNTDSVSTEIMREYQKEFIQEGQTFYYYKRLNKDLKKVTNTTALDVTGAYVWPVPDQEKEYNNP